MTRQPDPTERRAKLVVPSENALEVTALVRKVNDEIERRYRRRLGVERYSALRSALKEISEGQAPTQPRIRP